jgi:peroxiredoxin
LGDTAKAALFEIRNLSIGRVAPEITGDDVYGKPLTLSEHRGKVILLVFCGHWCGPCRASYPAQRDLVKELIDQSFVMLSVNSDENRDQIKDLMMKKEITWHSWWDGGSRSGPIGKSWNVAAWPTIYVLGADGVIRYRGHDHDSATAIVRLLLKKRP